MQTLEVAIGLVCVYLMLSLVCTAAEALLVKGAIDAERPGTTAVLQKLHDDARRKDALLKLATCYDHSLIA